MGITGLSKSQVSAMATDLDEQVEAFRTRPLDAGPYTFLAADALTVRVREGGRVIKVAAMVATGVNAEGYREILGLQLSTAEDGAGWLGFFRGPDRPRPDRGGAGHLRCPPRADRRGRGDPARGVWQRCRTHFAANLMAKTPKSAWPWVKALLHSVYDQPDAPSCTPSSTRW